MLSKNDLVSIRKIFGEELDQKLDEKLDKKLDEKLQPIHSDIKKIKRDVKRTIEFLDHKDLEFTERLKKLEEHPFLALKQV